MPSQTKDSPRLLLKDMMTRNVETISPTAGIQEAAQQMKRLNVGAIPVCEGARLRGMLTDRDIVLRIVAENRPVETGKVQEAMSPEVTYCFEDQELEEAVQIMREKQIRRLPVLSREKQLVGIVTLGDVAVKSGEREGKAQTL